MADVKKTVDVAINVTGTNPEALNKLATSFTEIGNAVQKATEMITGLKTQLDTIKTPDNLTTIVSGVKELASVKVPNIKQMAEGFERLAKIKAPPDLSKFATELDKFTKIKVPNIKQLAVGLEKLTDASLSMTAVGARLRIVSRNLKSFSELKVPNLKSFVESLQKLTDSSLSMTAVGNRFRVLYRNIKQFSELKLPNIAGLVKGLRELTDSSLSMTAVGSRLRVIQRNLKSFSDIRIPNITSIVNGLKKLTDSSLSMGEVGGRLRVLYRNLKSFSEINLPNITKIVTSLKNLTDSSLSMTAVGNRLRILTRNLVRFSDVKLPNISALVTGLKKLTDSSLSMAAVGNRLRVLQRNLKDFTAIKMPNITGIVSGLKKLVDSTLNMGDVGARLRILYRNLKNFTDIKVPNITKIAAGLTELNQVAAINVQTKALSSLADFLVKLNGIKVPNLTTLSAGLKELGSATIKLLPAIQTLNTLYFALRQYTTVKIPNLQSFVNGLKKIEEVRVGPVTEKLKELNVAIAELDKAGYLKNFATFANDLRKIAPALNTANAALEKYSGAVKKASTETKGWGERIKNYFQYRFIADAVFSIKEAIVGSFTAIKDYDQALKDLQAITGATSLEVSQMGETIKEVASTTKFSASEVAAGMRIIGQAGFSASESVETMQAVSDLATGTLSDMGTTVDLVTTAMRVFRIEASESASVADVFANAVNRSKLTIDKLRTSFNYVGPIARDAGISFKEMSAAMMTLANSGLRASTIGTGLRRVFAELVDPSKKLSEAAKNAGINLRELDPTANSLKDVISGLSIVVSDAKVAFDVFGKRGAAAVLALSDTTSDFNAMLETVDRSGVAAEQARIQMEGLGVSFKNLQDKLGLLAISFGESGISGILKFLIDISRKVIDVFTSLVNTSIGGFIVSTTAMISVITLAVAAFTALTKSIIAASIITKLGAAFTLVISPIVRATTALLGFATALNVTTTSSIVGLTISLGVLAGVIAPLIILLGIFVSKLNDMDDAFNDADGASKLASDYDSLFKKFTNYNSKVSQLSEGSDELKESNLDLRKSLLKTASGLTSISDEARAAANSIDPLNGIIKDGGAAIAAYGKELKALEFKALVEAANKANEALELSGGLPQRISSAWKQSIASITGTVSNLGVALVAKFEGDGEASAKAWTQAWSDWFGEGNDRIRISNTIANDLSKGKVSFKELSDYVKSLDGFDKLYEQEQKIADGFNKAEEHNNKLFDSLQRTGEITLYTTEESIRRIGENSDYSKDVVEALIEKLSILKDQNEKSFNTNIKRWREDLLHGVSLIDQINAAKAKGVQISKEEIVEMNNLKTAQIGLINEKDSLDSHYAQDLEAARGNIEEKRRINENYANDLADIKERELDLAKKIGNNEKLYVVKSVTDAKQALELKLKDIKANYGDTLEAHIKNADARLAYDKKIAQLTTTVYDPKKLVANSKAAITEIKASYELLYKALNLDIITGNIESKKKSLAKLRELEAKEADEIFKIRLDTYKKILEATGPDSEESRKAKAKMLDAQIAQGKLTVAQAKAIADEEKTIRENAYETANATRESANQAHIEAINKQVAQGVISYAQGEQLKLEASVKFYADRLSAAKKYTLSINKDIDPESYQDALQDELKAEENLYKARAKAFEDYNKKAKKLSEDFTKNQKKLRDEEEKHGEKLLDIKEDNAEKLIDIEDDYADSVRDINYDLQDKLKDFEQKRLDITKDYAEKRKDVEDEFASDISDNSNDIQDEIDKLNQRDMSDAQKARDDEYIAYRELSELKSRFSKAKEENNVEEIKSILDRTDKIKDLYAEMENTGLAESKLKKLKLFKEDVITAGRDITLDNIAKDERLEKAKLQKEIKNAKELHNRKMLDLDEEYNEKLSKQESHFNDSIVKEDSRHDKAMENIKIEAKAKLEAAIEVAKALEVLTQASSPNTSTNEITGSSTTPKTGADTTLEKIKESGNEVSNVLNKAIATARQAGVDIEATLGKSMEKASQAGKKGFEEFIIITNKAGEQIITTARSMSEGFPNFGEIVKTESLASVKALKDGMDATSESAIKAGVAVKEADKSTADAFAEGASSAASLQEIIVNPNNWEAKVKVDFDKDEITKTKQLLTEVADIAKNRKIEYAVDVVTKAAVGKLKDVQDNISDISDNITAINGFKTELFTKEDSANIRKINDEFSSLFRNIDSSAISPAQTAQDMITTIEGMGTLTRYQFNEMSKEIVDFVSKHEGLDLEIDIGTGKLSVVDELGQKIDGLYKKIQQNPAPLFSSTYTKDIINDFNEINGSIDLIRENSKERVALAVETDSIQSDIDSTVASLEEPVEITIDANTTPINDKLSALETSTEFIKEVIIEDNIDDVKEKLKDFDNTVIDTLNTKWYIEASPRLPAHEQIESVKESLESVGDNLSPIVLQLDATALYSLIDTLDAGLTTSVEFIIEGEDEVTQLLNTLTDSEGISVKISATVTDETKEDVNYLKSFIEELMDNPLIFTITMKVDKALSSIKKLLKEISKLEDKTITINTKSSGSSSNAYADGGEVFKRLPSPFISQGSGRIDDVPAMLMRGEFVLKQSAVKKYGLEILNALNNGALNLENLIPKAYADGGLVNVQKFSEGGSALLNKISSFSMPNTMVQMLSSGGLVNSGASGGGTVNIKLELPVIGPPVNIQADRLNANELASQLMRLKRSSS